MITRTERPDGAQALVSDVPEAVFPSRGFSVGNPPLAHKLGMTATIWKRLLNLSRKELPACPVKSRDREQT